MSARWLASRAMPPSPLLSNRGSARGQGRSSHKEAHSSKTSGSWKTRPVSSASPGPLRGAGPNAGLRRPLVSTMGTGRSSCGFRGGWSELEDFKMYHPSHRTAGKTETQGHRATPWLSPEQNPDLSPCQWLVLVGSRHPHQGRGNWVSRRLTPQ